MIKENYRDYIRKGEEKKPLSDKAKQLRQNVIAIGKAISSRSKDTGTKGGRRSTNYEYDLDRLQWGGWSADCESMYSLKADGVHIATVYDCHGQGFFEYINEKTITKIYEQVIKETRIADVPDNL